MTDKELKTGTRVVFRFADSLFLGVVGQVFPGGSIQFLGMQRLKLCYDEMGNKLPHRNKFTSRVKLRCMLTYSIFHVMESWVVDLGDIHVYCIEPVVKGNFFLISVKHCLPWLKS